MLVAEDNRTNQKVIGKMLDRAGHGATIVGSGQEAVDALDEAAFDIVLMDLNMPELGGIEAVKLLRFAHDPEALPPIVALSADATPQTREACRSVGAGPPHQAGGRSLLARWRNSPAPLAETAAARVRRHRRVLGSVRRRPGWRP